MANTKDDKDPTETHAYDKILKENIGQLFLPLAEKQLGIRIQKSEELKDKLQTTLEREADFLREITTASGERFILQLEFQTANEADMVYRMQEYHAILRRKHSLPVRQFVYYLGTAPLNMNAKLPEQEVYRGFQLESISNTDYRAWLASEVPEEIMLALLADFGKETAAAVLQKVLSKFLQLKQEPVLLEKYIRQMRVLARLRENVKSTFDTQINAMGLTYDVEKDALYQKGMAKGMAEGKQEGGYLKALATAEKCLLEGIGTEVTAKLTELPLAEVEKIARRLKK